MVRPFAVVSAFPLETMDGNLYFAKKLMKSDFFIPVHERFLLEVHAG